jgi:LacI family transcriptional regulator, gluconate utilization system Gnt-I transcriptional repressor
MPGKTPPRQRAKVRRESKNAARSTGSVTLADVAKLAGVSPITVSRVLNRPELVTAQTSEHVQQVIERTGYTPNLLAGGLASRRSRLVAAIVPSITNAIFVETVEALTDRLWEAGYQVLLGLSGYPATREDALLAAVLSRRPDAIYLTGINHSKETRRRLLTAGIPVVETWDLTPTPIDMLVGFSHEKVGESVARHLLAKGYRRFGLVSADDERAQARRQGFVAEMARAGIANVETVTVPAPSTLALGRQGLAALLDRGVGGKRPDAVFCGSDLLAHGALEEARARGLAVPGKLAIMGFGGLDFTRHTTPALSTVSVDRPAIGRLAAEVILARIEGEQSSGQVVDVGFQITDRDTT